MFGILLNTGRFVSQRSWVRGLGCVPFKAHVLLIQCFLSKAHCRWLHWTGMYRAFSHYKTMPMNPLSLAAKHESQTHDRGIFL